MEYLSHTECESKTRYPQAAPAEYYAAAAESVATRESLATRESRHDTRSVRSAHSVVRDSVAPGKKWVWDEWDDDAVPNISNLTGHYFPPNHHDDDEEHDANTTTESTTRHSAYLDDTLTSLKGEKYSALTDKIRLMRSELEEKRAEVESLKASVQRRKVSDERVCEQITKSWEERLRKRAKEHTDAISRQTSFIEQVSLSNASIATRRTGLEEVLKYKKANYTPAVETARRENAEALKKARDEWLGSEKLRLDKLAERKTGELKKDAVSALEPELHRLISGNKLDLEQRRELRDDEFEAFCAQQEREGELKMQDEFLKIEQEAMKEAENIRKQQSTNLMDLTQGQEEDLRRARDIWKSDMEQERSSFEVERRRLVAGYSKEMEELRKAEGERLSDALKEQENQLDSLQEQKQNALKQRQRYMADHMENWQRERLNQLRSEQRGKDDIARKALREQSEAELSMVLAKLNAQATDERAAIQSKVADSVEAFKMNLRKEEERLNEEEQTFMGRFAAEHEKTTALQEEVSLLESRVVGMERRVASTEENMKVEKGKSDRVRRDCEARMEGLRRGQEKSVELAAHEVASLQKQLQDLETTFADCGGVQEKELARLQSRLKRELEDVENRVRLVVERKAVVLRSKEAELKELTKESKQLTDQLDEFRRKDIDLEGMPMT